MNREMIGMGQVEFLHALFETGQVKVGPVAGPLSSRPAGSMGSGAADGDGIGGGFSEGRSPLDVVREWDAANRLEFPGEAPELIAATAERAVDFFYRACQFTVYRDVDAQTVAALFAEPVNGAAAAKATPAEHYTVDLVFRFLPELFRLAHRASGADPLCDGLRLWAHDWPLSSIGVPPTGMAEVNPDDLAAVCDDGGLLRLYADRVIARRDVSRLADPRVRGAVRTALGYYDDLCSPIARALKSYEPPLAAAAAASDASPGGDPPSPPST